MVVFISDSGGENKCIAGSTFILKMLFIFYTTLYINVQLYWSTSKLVPYTKVNFGDTIA